MDLYEYQGKQFFARYGIPVSPGEAVTTVDDAVAAAERIGYPVVVKAQVQVGGRGKAGGIKLADDADEVRTHAGNILGMDIKGHTVETRVDRARLRHRRGVLRQLHPRPLGQEAPRHAVGPGRRRDRGRGRREPRRHRQDLGRPGRRAHRGAGPGLGGGRQARPAGHRRRRRHPAQALQRLRRGRRRPGRDQPADPQARPARCTRSTPRSRSTATRRSATTDYEAYEATQVRDEREQAAHDKGLQYVGLDGYVGVIANGAGLAMSTVDIVNQVGGEPANFLDIGGGASAEVMAGALEVINNDPNVRSIFINIFGGITKGEEVANGIVTALGRVQIDVPIVIRLDGTNADLGREILEPHLSDKLQMQPTMVDAAQAVVALAGK